MKQFALFVITSVFSLGAFSATTQSSPTTQSGGGGGPAGHELHGACKADIEKLCPDVKPGEGRIVACMKAHQDEISEGCKQAFEKAHAQKAGGANSGTPAKN